MNSRYETLTVGQLVAEKPIRARVFEGLKIDYCCGGKKLLDAVCLQQNLVLEDVVRVLLAFDSTSENSDLQDWTSVPLKELIDHIVTRHHAYLKRELPRISKLLDKVVHAHGQKHPEMKEIQTIFNNFAEELTQHMTKEELILFPLCLKLETAKSVLTMPCGGTLQGAVGAMEAEHENAGEALAKMRALSNDFQAPADGCNTFRVLMDSLAELEKDMHQHVHKENNILFLRAVELERNHPGLSII